MRQGLAAPDTVPSVLLWESERAGFAVPLPRPVSFGGPPPPRLGVAWPERLREGVRRSAPEVGPTSRWPRSKLAGVRRGLMEPGAVGRSPAEHATRSHAGAG